MADDAKNYISSILVIFIVINAFSSVSSIQDAPTQNGENLHVITYTNQHELPNDISNTRLSEELARDVNARCVLCKYFVGKLDDALEAPATQAMIKNAVVQACRNILNISLCDTLGNTVMNYLENMLQTQLQPDAACVAAKFCPPNFQIDVEEDLILVREMESALGCKLCGYFVDHIEPLAVKITDGVKKLLYPYCSRLPPPTDKECRDSIEQMINSLITKYFTKASICTKTLHVC